MELQWLCHTAYSVRGSCTLGVDIWVYIMFQPKESDFTTGADSRTGHLLLLPWFSAPVQFISQKGARNPILCKSLATMYSTPPSFRMHKWVGSQVCWPCSTQGVATLFSSIISILLSFYPQAFSHTREEQSTQSPTYKIQAQNVNIYWPSHRQAF